jgi:hypothetical protein
VQLNRTAPGNFDAEFAGRLKKGTGAWQAIATSPSAKWLHSLLTPWATGRTRLPDLTGTLEYEMVLSCSPSPAGTAAGLTPQTVETAGSVYKVEVETKDNSTITRQLFRLALPVASKHAEIPEAVPRFLNDYGCATLVVPLQAPPAAPAAPASP